MNDQHLVNEGDTAAAAVETGKAFVVDIDGYEGPIDVLLTLAREQKVDLKQVSIVQLADQYLAFVAEVRRANLELAAEYLVMAAWLAYLKSRLLLPEPPADEEPSGEEMAAALSFQLQRLEAMREAGAQLVARPRLGRDFSRGDNRNRLRHPFPALFPSLCMNFSRPMGTTYGASSRKSSPSSQPGCIRCGTRWSGWAALSAARSVGKTC